MVAPQRSGAETTKLLYEALRLRYAEPEWLVWEEMTMDGFGRADGDRPLPEAQDPW